MDTLKERFQTPAGRYRVLQIIHSFDSFGRDEATLRQRMAWLKAPGIDIFSSDPLALAAGHGFLVPDLISSAAHVMGRCHTMSETSDVAEQMSNRRASLAQRRKSAGGNSAWRRNAIRR